MSESLYREIIDRLPKPEKVPLPKLMEAVLPYQAGIYVTVLNIIQYIALAFLINEVRETYSTGEFNFYSACRSILALEIILVVWHRYIAELQYPWQISWIDTLGPFSVGIVECMIIFSINATKVPLKWFLLFIIFLQILAMIAYGYAYLQRTLKVTERLYKEFYKDYPIFADYLIMFLKLYDLWSLQLMCIFLIQVAMFFAFVWIFPLEVYDQTFTLACIPSIIAGEYLRGFHKYLTNDPVLGPCFTKGGE